ncbi:MAG: histidine phosphatase family protein [Pseudomonadota bacterium]
MSESSSRGEEGGVAPPSAGRRVYLVRHGEAAASWAQAADPGLSAEGHEQAADACRALALRLENRPVALISSPLRRARETAAPLSERLGMPVKIDERFREIPSPVALEQRQDWLRAFMRRRWSMQAASLHEWRNRVLGAFATLEDQSVVFTHFLVLNTILGWAEHRDETLLYWPANASITVASEDTEGHWDFEPGEQMRSRVN